MALFKNHKIRNPLIFILITISFIGFALHTYSPNFYYGQYLLHNTYDEIPQKTAESATNNLIKFFFHIEKPNEKIFTKEEIQHYYDVRFIYDSYFFLFIFSLLFLYVLKPKKKEIISTLEKIRYILLAPLVLIPFFGYFWNTIFHSFLFSNNFWIMQPHEISYYLFPLEFFSIALISIIIFCELIVFVLLYELKYKKHLNL